jgi:hypothetical protein
MKKTIIVLITFSLMPFLTVGQTVPTVSFIQLLANPEKYDGKTIQVIGYLNIEFEGNAIYLHKEDRVHMITHNAFWVRFSKDLTLDKDKAIKDFSGQYVIIVGVFSMKEHGHMGLFEGSINEISRLDVW